ncbi:hypothetical protein [Bacillus sp. AFS017336]|nr:hypothetical protein [Bacillus sp. AFS017336]
MTTLLVMYFMVGFGLAGFLAFMMIAPKSIKALFNKWLWNPEGE